MLGTAVSAIFLMPMITRKKRLYALKILFLLFATFVLHGELYRLRPGTKELTAYYLYISLGGVIGGAVFKSEPPAAAPPAAPDQMDTPPPPAGQI